MSLNIFIILRTIGRWGSTVKCNGSDLGNVPKDVDIVWCTLCLLNISSWILTLTHKANLLSFCLTRFEDSSLPKTRRGPSGKEHKSQTVEWCLTFPFVKWQYRHCSRQKSKRRSLDDRQSARSTKSKCHLLRVSSRVLLRFSVNMRVVKVFIISRNWGMSSQRSPNLMRTASVSSTQNVAQKSNIFDVNVDIALANAL